MGVVADFRDSARRRPVARLAFGQPYGYVVRALLVSAEPCYQEIAVVESYQRGCMALFERTVVAEQEIPFRQGRVFPFDVHGAFRFRL